MATQIITGGRVTHRIYNVIGSGENAGWTPIGAVYGHDDGKGFNIVLDGQPLFGRCVAREINEHPTNSTKVA